MIALTLTDLDTARVAAAEPLLTAWLHAGSQGVLCLAFASALAGLHLLQRGRARGSVRILGRSAGAFLALGGVAHGLNAIGPWWSAPTLSPLVEAGAALAAVGLVIALFRALPALAPGPDARSVRANLEAALGRERHRADALVREFEALEERTGQLALRERRMREAAAGAKACAVSWAVESGEILWQTGCTEAMCSAGVPWHVDLNGWSLLIGDVATDRLRREAVDACREGRTYHGWFDLVDHEGGWQIRITATPDPEVKGAPATMTGMFGLVPAGAPSPGVDARSAESVGVGSSRDQAATDSRPPDDPSR